MQTEGRIPWQAPDARLGRPAHNSFDKSVAFSRTEAIMRVGVTSFAEGDSAQ